MKYRRQSGTFQFEEYTFSKNSGSNSKKYHEVLLLMNFLQTKPQVKCRNGNFYDLYYTVNEKRNEKEIVKDQ